MIRIRSEVEIAGLDESADAERILQIRTDALNRQMEIQRDRVRILTAELQSALTEMQKANIAPVDMAQAAIGPGISVYSRYEKVIDAEGKAITVRDALKLINAALDEYLNGQGEKLDAATLFCVDLYMH